ncbi:PBECR4 domain-containing protein [Ligilactobacillus sp. 110_WCHN]|uniref:PBECR4 domain-containing protein n=1 Tax=Ligilactobacillus sp. 110_WCHN TaxID=3057125 RepID=UPI002673358C|nr:PBECR4 domain-containing protein [Ligilactobacillus sp. 110_WCHN]MDO3393627.1 PBECR4 domain-containing protein [Ligilactobacillus sp. 110_WCHN]
MSSGSRGKHLFFLLKIELQVFIVLKQCIKSCKKLINYTFILTLGYKGKLTIKQIKFDCYSFPHLFGIHKLNDLNNKTRRKIKKEINSLKLSDKSIRIIENSNFYSQISDRLEILSRMMDIFNDETIKVHFHSNKHTGARTKINWDYLINFELNNQNGYIFFVCDKNVKDNLVCNSLFFNETTKYEAGQKRYAILKIELIDEKSRRTLLYKKKGLN